MICLHLKSGFLPTITATLAVCAVLFCNAPVLHAQDAEAPSVEVSDRDVSDRESPSLKVSGVLPKLSVGGEDSAQTIDYARDEAKGEGAQEAQIQEPFDPYSVYEKEVLAEPAAPQVVGATENQSQAVVTPDSVGVSDPPSNFVFDDTHEDARADFYSDTNVDVRADGQTLGENMAAPTANIDSSALVLARADIAPFYLTVSEYLHRRGERPMAQTTLVYTVSTEPLTEPLTDPLSESKTDQGTSETVTLLIGPDYVARQNESAPEDMRIYDFKYNRLLRIIASDDPKDNRPSFINAPLYAIAHRNTRTVARMTNNGALDTVDMGPLTLDAFWIESAMSWSMNDRLPNIDSEREDKSLSLSYKDEPVFSITFDDGAYTDPAQSDAHLVFAHHEWPVHPTALRQLFAAPAPLRSMMIVSKSPHAPKGRVQRWELTSRSDRQAPFPLPKGAVNRAVSADSQNPVTFVVNAAARNTALGGRPTQDDLNTAVAEALRDEDLVKAWLAAKRYEALTGACEPKTDNSACNWLKQSVTTDELPSELHTLRQAFEASKTPAKRVSALKALSPWLKDTDVAAIIMRTIGITRAKIDTATAKASGLNQLDAETIIKTALAGDPYDPNTYVGLAQYYAARGDFEAAWDVYDVLRSAIDTRAGATFGVDTVERALIERAPGYFEQPVLAQR